MLKVLGISVDISRVESTNKFVDPLVIGVLKSLENLLFKLVFFKSNGEPCTQLYQFTEIVDGLGNKDSKSHFDRNGNFLFRSNSLCNVEKS